MPVLLIYLRKVPFEERWMLPLIPTSHEDPWLTKMLSKRIVLRRNVDGIVGDVHSFTIVVNFLATRLL